MRTNGEFSVVRDEYSIKIDNCYLELFLYENITKVNKLCNHKMVNQKIKQKLISLSFNKMLAYQQTSISLDCKGRNVSRPSDCKFMVFHSSNMG